MSESELQNYKANGYNPSTGIFVSPFIFTGNWENELRALDFTPRSKPVDVPEIAESDKDKGINDGYLYNSFKSANGKSNFHDQLKDFWEEELPEDFSWTDSYYNSPKLRAIIDWFQCEKSRVRIFQQKAGHWCPVHNDFDNQKGMEAGETVRIFVQLNDMSDGAWFRCKTADSDVTVNLRKGQFLIFHPDRTGHGTQNITAIPRDTFMMVVKRNEWIDSLGNGDDKLTFIDVDQLAAKNNKTKVEELVAA
jgi:hypothetical protein